MPYTIKKVKGGYKVRGPSGYKSKKPLSKARARAQQKALYVHAPDKKKRKRS
jgi:hypothetical protein